MATTILLEGDSESKINLILELAKKLGVKSAFLSKEELTDTKLGQLMEKEKTGKLISEKDILRELEK